MAAAAAVASTVAPMIAFSVPLCAHHSRTAAGLARFCRVWCVEASDIGTQAYCSASMSMYFMVKSVARFFVTS